MLRLFLTFFIFFSSGVAGLIYEVLWMKQLGLLFGNTAQSVAAATAAFFMGIAAGSYVWGERLKQDKTPLRTYALLEFGIVIAALFYFVVFAAWTQLFPLIFEQIKHSTILLTMAKLFLTVLLICPATFLMGGTLPVMGQHLVREAKQLGRWSGWLYGINTFGAAVGALLTGFFLIEWLGFNQTYVLALAVSTSVGVIALWLSRSESSAPVEETLEQSEASGFERLQIIAFVSGFSSLALQVLWTRMFVQVLQNSVYTYTAILAIFLLALSLGALITRALVRLDLNPVNTLSVLLTLSALVVFTVPFGFMWWTDDLRYLAEGAEFTSYLSQVVTAILLLVGVPTVVMGVLLPYLYKYAETVAEKPGVIIGRLNSWNTVGAVIGSVFAGFVLLDWLGLWNSIRLIGVIYLVTTIYFLLTEEKPDLRFVYTSMLAIMLSVTLFDTGRLSVVRIQAVAKNEALLDVWEGSGGTVAVVKRNNNLRIKLNNWYSLGGSGAQRMERMQSHLPINLHPDPKKIFYLGLGTGITAGGALGYEEVEEVVIAELVGDVIKASEKYFEPYTQGLFQDDRVTVVNEDGRNYLRASREQFDLIIADLFIPWRSGVGYLYTVEHFTAAKERLNDDGLFVQWIPLYQVTDRELNIISKSLLEVFPQVTLWRGDFYASKPMLALVGHQSANPLSPDTMMVQSSIQGLRAYRSNEHDQIPILAHYVGQLSEESAGMKDTLLNTDNQPWIEYLAPRSHRTVKAGLANWMTEDALLQYLQDLQRSNEPPVDPYLSLLGSDMHRVVYAGLIFHIASVAKEQKKNAVSKEALETAKMLLTE